MESRITKLEKGVFVIEYRDETTRFAQWKQVEKTFKTLPKAEEYVRRNGLNKKRRVWR